MFWFILQVWGLVSAVSNDAENVHEEVDDVQVEVEGGEHILLGAERVLVAAPHHQLSVVDDVEAEDDTADACIHKVQSPKHKLPFRIDNLFSCTHLIRVIAIYSPAGWEEKSNESKYHETHEDSNQHS